MDPAKALTFREELPEEVSTERLATRIQSDKGRECGVSKAEGAGS